MVSAICLNKIVLFPVKYIPNAPTITELNEKLRKASNDNLGMTRNTNESIDDKMIQTGRQTLYNLFGAGLHRRNGLNPKIAPLSLGSVLFLFVVGFLAKLQF